MSGQQPLLEPALLVSDNCQPCRGTGEQVGAAGGVCGHCEGSGREVREMPLAQAWELAQRTHERLVAPPPSALRERATSD